MEAARGLHCKLPWMPTCPQSQHWRGLQQAHRRTNGLGDPGNGEFQPTRKSEGPKLKVSSRLQLPAAAASALLASLVLTPTNAFAQVNVWTHHNDNARSGANLSEVQLNTGNVNASQFGKLFQYSVDAAVFAQPLVISNLSIPGGGVRNVVFVATMNNSVYAFDADDPTTDSYQPIWQVSFNNPAAGVTTIPSSELMPNTAYVGPYGIMGTPVIDQSTGTMYLVVRTKESGAYFQRLRALDITTGQERPGSGVAINAAVTNRGVTTVFSAKMRRTVCRSSI